MRRGQGDFRRLWVPAFAVGALALVLVMALFRAPSPPSPPPPFAPGPTLGLAPSQEASPDSLFSEDEALHDPAPLFLPTQWSSTGKAPPRRGSDIAFTGYDPEFAFGQSELRLDLPPAVAVPSRPADALAAYPPGHPFVGFGRAAVEAPELPVRGAFLAVVGAGNGQPILSESLNDLPAGVADSPPAAGSWQFLAAIDAAGLVGPLVQTVRSGTAADGFFLDYLGRKWRIGERLPPGMYRVSIGP